MIQLALEHPGGRGESTSIVEEVEVNVDVDVAMAAVMGAAECLNPTYEEAKRRSDWPKWEEAMKTELTSLEKNGTWSVIECPQGANVVNSKWVLCIKKNMVGKIEKYKGRVVARGFTQTHGIDYYEMHAPVARLASFQLLIAMANRNEWPLDSFDFDSAYLNLVLPDDEKIYLERLKGYQKGDRKKYVLQLHKALYGLKQGARSWYETLRTALGELGFERTAANQAVFLKTWQDRWRIIVAVHVDDCLTMGSGQKLVDEFKERINKKYSITDLGPC